MFFLKSHKKHRKFWEQIFRYFRSRVTTPWMCEGNCRAPSTVNFLLRGSGTITLKFQHWAKSFLQYILTRRWGQTPTALRLEGLLRLLRVYDSTKHLLYCSKLCTYTLRFCTRSGAMWPPFTSPWGVNLLEPYAWEASIVCNAGNASTSSWDTKTTVLVIYHLHSALRLVVCSPQ